MSNDPASFQHLSAADTDRIIEMGWEDRTPFEAIEAQFGLPEKDVIALMRKTMKGSSFRMWRKRMAGRSTKHRPCAPMEWTSSSPISKEVSH